MKVPNIHLSKFPKTLRRLRNGLGWTQPELESLLLERLEGFPTPTVKFISLYETGARKSISVQIIEALDDILEAQGELIKSSRELASSEESSLADARKFTGSKWELSVTMFVSRHISPDIDPAVAERLIGGLKGFSSSSRINLSEIEGVEVFISAAQALAEKAVLLEADKGI